MELEQFSNVSSWGSYPKIYNLGHPEVSNIMDGNVLIEEKVDGSQFSFGVFEGELRARSKGQELIIDAPEQMFQLAIDQIQSVKHILVEGWTYRGEYLKKPKHNCMAYERVPKKNIIIFDINDGYQKYLSYESKIAVCNIIGFECVPRFALSLQSIDDLNALLEQKSVLGNTKIEGIVIKNYELFGRDKKVLMGKFVSEAFKEKNSKNYRKDNPTGKDFIALLSSEYKTEARWHKAIQHLRDDGKLTNTPKDIGVLIKEISNDTKEECREEIMDKLFKYAWPHIGRVITRGFPEFYKKYLAEKQFE